MHFKNNFNRSISNFVFFFIQLAKSCKQFDLRKFKEMFTMIVFFGTPQSNEDDLTQAVWGITNLSKENEQGQQSESKGKEGRN